MADPTLRTVIKSKIEADLPHTKPNPTGLQQTPLPPGQPLPPVQGQSPTPTPMAQVMTAYLQSKAAKEGPQPVSKKLAGLEHALGRLFGTNDESLFPPFWLKIANTNKADRGMLITNLLRQQANSSRGTKVYPSVSPGLIDTITHAKFGSEQQARLEEGLSVFAMAVSVGASNEAARKIVIFEAAMDGSAKPTMGELRELVRYS